MRCQMNITNSLKKYLVDKNFYHERGSKTYCKPMENHFILCVEIKCEPCPVIKTEPDHWREIDAPFYDLKFDILSTSELQMEKIRVYFPSITLKKYLTNVGCLISLCSLHGKPITDWIEYQESDEMQILNDIIRTFEQDVYVPLFETKGFSLFKYLCWLDQNRGQEISYNSSVLLEAAITEKRWSDALFCIRCTIAQRSPLLDAYGFDPVLQRPRTLQQLESYITEDMIKQFLRSEDPIDVIIANQYREILKRIENQ